jgi:hypothetical protein
MQKWEYCAVGPLEGLSMGRHPYLCHFTVEGQRLSRIEKTRGISERDMVAQTITQLGNDGWEMVGCGTMWKGDRHLLYFKRPQP